ncbi:MAG: glycosyltransferase [Verrucomicrobiota bacterium]|nr:glycosyltransferase [Verrucomicrobiota bacterium]
MHQFIHSLDLHTGGVCEAVIRLNVELRRNGFEAKAIDCSKEAANRDNFSIAHGLWQWPSVIAHQNWKRRKTPYLVFPHGMLDRWFKKTYPLKHLKKQMYWWLRQGKILENAHAVCFTTEEERHLARKTFWPYKCREVVTGLGVGDPPGDEKNQVSNFHGKFPQIRGKDFLLYMGRIHPKKGLDLLLKALDQQKKSNDLLVIAAPISEDNAFYNTLRRDFKDIEGQILWTDMLEGDLKWGALRAADSLILPSHQENYGMVVAEACSVGTPVLISNKVNLYHEILEYDAGFVENDTLGGVNLLLDHWTKGKMQTKSQNARKCFREKLHISRTAEKVIQLFEEVNENKD